MLNFLDKREKGGCWYGKFFNNRKSITNSHIKIKSLMHIIVGILSTLRKQELKTIK